MSYSFNDAINNSRLINGLSLKDTVISGQRYDHKTYLRIHDLNNETLGGKSAPGPFQIGKINAYPYAVRSIVLVGCTVVNGKMQPNMFHVDPAAWMNAKVEIDSNLSHPRYIKETNPASNYPLEVVQIPGVRMHHNELKKLNKSFETTHHVPVGSASFWGQWNKSTISWTFTDAVTAGHISGTASNNTTTTVYDRGCTSAVGLVYMNEFIEELELRYGFVTPDHLRPYSPANWLKVSNDMAKSDAIVFPNFGEHRDQWFYYRILYLPEFDYIIHRNVFQNPQLMTEQFVRSEPFRQMIISMGRVVNRNKGMEVASNQFGYWNNQHKSNLFIGESLVAGQYVYGTDFTSKLFLRSNGHVALYRFPIEAATRDGCITHDLTKTAFSNLNTSFQFLRDLPFNCVLYAQPDKNIVIYANGTLTYDYTTKPGQRSEMYKFDTILGMGFRAIASTQTGVGQRNRKKGLADSTIYGLIVYPTGTGASIMCNKPGTNMIDYDHAADTQNYFSKPGEFNDNCVVHWRYKTNDIILDTTTLGSTNNDQWCYSSWLTNSDKSDTTNNSLKIISSNNETQYEMNRFGTLPSDARNILRNALYNSEFINRAIALGFMKQNGTDGNFNAFSTTNAGFCLRGRRLITDPTCKMNELLEFDANLKPFFTQKVNSLCTANETSSFCDFMVPKTQIIRDMTRIDARYAEIVIRPGAYYALSSTGLVRQISNDEKAAIFLSAFKTGTLSASMLELIYGPIFYSSNTMAKTTWKAEYKKVYESTGTIVSTTTNGTSASSVSVNPIESKVITFGNLNNMYNSLLSTFPTTLIFWKSDLGVTMLAGEIDSPYTMSANVDTRDLLVKALYNASNVKNFSDGYNCASFAIYPSTQTMALSEVKEEERYMFLNTVYDYVVLNPGKGDIHIFFKSLNKEKVLTGLKTLVSNQFWKPDEMFNTVCKTVPELCVPTWSDYIMNKPYDAITDGVCDRIVMSITQNNDDLSRFEKNSAQALLPLCTISNARLTCSAPDKRYKKDSFMVRPSRKAMFESFSTDSCGTICNSTEDDALKSACELGSVSYCTQTPNNQYCADDALKYPAVMDIMKKYCPTNPTSEFCKGIEFTPLPTTSSTTTSPIVPSTEVTTTNVVKADSSGNLYLSTQPILTTPPAVITSTETSSETTGMPAASKTATPIANVRFTQSGKTYSLSGSNILTQNTQYVNGGYKATITVLPNTDVSIVVDGTNLKVSSKIPGNIYDTYEITNTEWREGSASNENNGSMITPSNPQPTSPSTETTEEKSNTTMYIFIGAASVAAVLAAVWYKRKLNMKRANNEITKRRNTVPVGIQRYTDSRPMSQMRSSTVQSSQSMNAMSKQVNFMAKQATNMSRPLNFMAKQATNMSRPLNFMAKQSVNMAKQSTNMIRR